MFTSKDIRCFVMTRNRPELLQQTLKTLLWQEGGPWDIWVVDNSTNDDTEKLIKTNYPQIHYARTYGGDLFVANLEKMQELMVTPYTLTLHDDDLLVPNYLQTALKALNYYPYVTGVFSKYKMFKSLDFPPGLETQKPSTQHWLIKNQADFALSFWHDPSCSWTGAILKSELYKTVNMAQCLRTFGKIFDWPMLAKAVQNGPVLVYTDYYLHYRVHPNQHTHKDASGITAEQLANWLRFFKDFAQTKKELQDIYILRAYDNALSNYNSFLSKKEQKLCADLPSWLVREGLSIPPMYLYNKTLENKCLGPLKHIFKFFYKKNYFKQFLTDFK